MRRADLEHVIRAAADVAGDDEIVVVGSQAILAQFPDAPAAMLMSREADVYPRNHPERATEIDRALGDGSYFDASFGYYAHGVGPETATAPAGWEDRLIAVRTEATGGATGWCLEAHDLVLAKCAAGRERDWDFAALAIAHGLVEPAELDRRLEDLPVDRADRRRIRTQLRGIAERAVRDR